ncbi:MAG: alpha/beta fold hydrolase [Betaproteobacteria bacterium]|nr:alpha/beta fold hydrolase [Betaproteobacteria bacterium]
MTDPLIKHAREHWISRYTVNGVLTSDFLDVTHSIERWEDWCAAWSARALVHETLGREALAAGQHLSAGEHLNRAATYYHFAKYLFVQDMAQHRAAHAKAVECLTLALPHLVPPGERVLIPYEGRQLAGVLRFPAGVRRPPVVLMTMGLDSTKEELGTFEMTFLERGMAILAFDGPGQGEAEYDFPIRADYEAVTGEAIDWLERRSDIDASRIGIWGISLGGYYAPRSAAFEKRLKACIANCGPWNFAARWDELPSLTRAAFRVRSHSSSDGEARERAGMLCLDGVAKRIECPLFVIAAGLDRLCPPEDARRLASEARGPVELVVIEGGNHVAHTRPYRYRPQSADWMARQLGARA